MNQVKKTRALVKGASLISPQDGPDRVLAHCGHHFSKIYTAFCPNVCSAHQKGAPDLTIDG